MTSEQIEKALTNVLSAISLNPEYVIFFMAAMARETVSRFAAPDTPWRNCVVAPQRRHTSVPRPEWLTGVGSVCQI